MTQEDKQLLLADLCARLPYRVIVHICSRGENAVRDVILSGDNITNAFEVPEGWWKEIKPYLRPMSSMTEEELKEFKSILNYNGTCDCFLIALKVGKITDANFALLVDWLNKNMFDYRGLIPKGLAIEAPEGMYGKEEHP